MEDLSIFLCGEINLAVSITVEKMATFSEYGIWSMGFLHECKITGPLELFDCFIQRKLQIVYVRN